MINIEAKKVEFAQKRATVKAEYENRISILCMEHRTAIMKLENEKSQKIAQLFNDEDAVLRQYQEERHALRLARYKELEDAKDKTQEQ